jgi:hypothetical protein
MMPAINSDCFPEQNEQTRRVSCEVGIQLIDVTDELGGATVDAARNIRDRRRSCDTLARSRELWREPITDVCEGGGRGVPLRHSIAHTRGAPCYRTNRTINIVLRHGISKQDACL